MSDTPVFDERELQREMADQAARAETTLHVSRRQSEFYRVFSKAQLLSDRDFELAMGALSQLVESCLSRASQNAAGNSSEKKRTADLQGILGSPTAGITGNQKIQG